MIVTYGLARSVMSASHLGSVDTIGAAAAAAATTRHYLHRRTKANDCRRTKIKDEWFVNRRLCCRLDFLSATASLSAADVFSFV